MQRNTAVNLKVTIIGSSAVHPFADCKDKTQVFPLDNSDFVRTRLTHSLEVSSIAKLIGKQVCIQVLDQQLAPAGDQPDSLKVIEILNCAGLLHDIGNPPFGHLEKVQFATGLRKIYPCYNSSNGLYRHGWMSSSRQTFCIMRAMPRRCV